jgi:hypothetical protein
MELVGKKGLQEAWDEFFCWTEAVPLDLESPLMQLFQPFFLFSWELDAELLGLDASWAEKTIAEVFLASHSGPLSAEDRQFLKAANRRPYSFYEISQVSPGEGFACRDLFLSSEVKVKEIAGSHDVQVGDIIYGALFEADGALRPLAMTPFKFPNALLEPLSAARQQVCEALSKSTLSGEDLLDYEYELRFLYMEFARPLLQPPLPQS